jgi:hypothetical protein
MYILILKIFQFQILFNDITEILGFNFKKIIFLNFIKKCSKNCI